MKSVKKLRVRSAKKHGFTGKAIRVRKDPPKQVHGYLKEKSSFILASLSLVAFIAGNMMGQHGWYAFWKATLGQYDDSLITYTGTVTPVASVPDYTKWSAYGGNAEAHTYKQVPKDLLIPLPKYDPKVEKKDFDHSPAGDVYSIGHMGSYDTGAEGDGSHIGVDIRIPVGTPIRAIANGIVTRVANDASGFGLLVVIRHPHSPDPENPEYETVLHSSYAHLSAQLVSEGEVVKKGQQIALSGKTGFATGPHLHFQVDRDEAPWHPYWPFSYSEAREAGMNTAQAINASLHQDRGYKYTVHPMLFVQANYPAAKFKVEPGKTIVKAKTTVATTKTPTTQKLSREELREQRYQKRLAARGLTEADVAAAKKQMAVAAAQSSVSSKAVPSSPSVIVQTDTVAAQTTQKVTEPAPVLVVPSGSKVTGVDYQLDRTFAGREWEKVEIRLVDADGNTVSADQLKTDIYLRTAYGEAEFKPSILTPLDFENGVAKVEMLPLGRRTVVIIAQPFQSLSKPMQYSEE